MVDLKSIISSFSPYDIKDYIQNNNYKKINLYVDLKNVSNGLWVSDIVQEIVQNTNITGQYDSSIFQSIIYYSSQWKKFCESFNIDLNIYFCCDQGKSVYHQNIDKEYKSNRDISKMNLPDCFHELGPIRFKNIELAERVVNKLPNIYFFNIPFLEADFLPYFLITRKFSHLEDTLHIVFSNDKDMFQVLNVPNVIMIYKSHGTKALLTKEDIYFKYLKLDKDSPATRVKYSNLINKVDTKWITAVMALVGDAGDGVRGLYKVGPKKALEMFSDDYIVSSLIGNDITDVFERVYNGGKFSLECLPLSKLSDKWKDVISNNDLVTRSFQLIDYEMLCKWLERKDKTEKIDKLNYLDNILNKTVEIDNVIDLTSSLSKNLPDYQLTENEIVPIFAGVT